MSVKDETLKNQPIKKYPTVGACGLNCGLCPRHYSSGSSRCSGCAGSEFFSIHPGCGFIACCVKKHGLETCAECPESHDCERVKKLFDSAKKSDSFISYKPIPDNYASIRGKGVAEFVRVQNEKEALLQYLLDNYDEGRSKGFYCISLQLLPLPQLKQAVADVEARLGDTTDVKEKARLMREAVTALAESLKIDLKLRK